MCAMGDMHTHRELWEEEQKWDKADSFGINTDPLYSFDVNIDLPDSFTRSVVCSIPFTGCLKLWVLPNAAYNRWFSEACYIWKKFYKFGRWDVTMIIIK